MAGAGRAAARADSPSLVRIKIGIHYLVPAGVLIGTAWRLLGGA